ncbi:hypothetical protein VB713_09005 [Anabaena cylindrica UHCC 0172]|uniref:hypothetical protein n=1 Tax=Anabaena cylindrica TaxID=1165 RepID=UPI002B1FE64D|nr:hypothetical protein [Anabaena cylindrica]MEA5551109.1 hypothetical protein [Anabaena cylindrica UHCC 0172]
MKSFKTILFISTILVTQIIATKTLAQKVEKDSIVPSQKDAIALAKNICGEGNITQQKGQVSCKTCPSFTESSDETGASITSVIYGSFTKAGTREALVDLNGCQPHAGNWGGSVLLRRTNQGWSRIRYEIAFRSTSCLKILNSTDRHSLICESSYVGMGHLITSLNQLEVGLTKTKTTNLLTVNDNTGTCQPPYYAMLIEDFTLRDTNKDSRADLVVKVSETRETKNNSTSNNRQCEDRSSLPKPIFHQLIFLSNGQSFSATPATTKLIEKLKP